MGHFRSSPLTGNLKSAVSISDILPFYFVLLIHRHSSNSRFTSSSGKTRSSSLWISLRQGWTRSCSAYVLSEVSLPNSYRKSPPNLLSMTWPPLQSNKIGGSSYDGVDFSYAFVVHQRHRSCALTSPTRTKHSASAGNVLTVSFNYLSCETEVVHATGCQS